MFNLPFPISLTTSKKLTFIFDFSSLFAQIYMHRPKMHCQSFPQPWFYRLCFKKFCFDIIHKITSIWGSELSTDSSSRYLLKKNRIKLKKIWFLIQSQPFLLYLFMQKLVGLFSKNLYIFMNGLLFTWY